MGTAHTPSTNAHDGSAPDVAVHRPADEPTVARGVEDPRAARVQRDLAKWKRFLHAEDRRCDEFRFAAALVTVGLHRASDLDAACRLLDTELRPTDHIAVLCADELSILLSPVDSIHHAQKLVHRLDTAFHSAAIDAHIGWAMRHEGHGLFHAAARADAAMLTAKGHGNLAFDLSKR